MRRRRREKSRGGKGRILLPRGGLRKQVVFEQPSRIQAVKGVKYVQGKGKSLHRKGGGRENGRDRERFEHKTGNQTHFC